MTIMSCRTESRSIPAWAGKPKRESSGLHRRQVHPRVGGETRWRSLARRSLRGPSPRGRGNRVPAASSAVGGRSIPAWAGKPITSRVAITAVTVHPRVGGETCASRAVMVSIAGPSPRGRGNRRALATARRAWRSIPAWAGKPSCVRLRGRESEVHPRVGGETWRAAGSMARRSGPSPRGRGNHCSADSLVDHVRSIPAWAGKPPVRLGRHRAGRVHPRKPRKRSSRCSRSIPAWAGKPHALRRERSRDEVHPRVGGETTEMTCACAPSRGPSPRGRGNLRDRQRWQARRRSIPAWAGKPSRDRSPWPSLWVHPRVGGETMR